MAFIKGSVLKCRNKVSIANGMFIDISSIARQYYFQVNELILVHIQYWDMLYSSIS